MKFLLRSLLVLVVAVLFGVVLYYAVRALPGDPASNSPSVTPQPNLARSTPQSLPPRPAGSGSTRREGIRWRSLLQVGRRMVVFSVLVWISVLAKNMIFERRTNRKKTAD